MYDPRRMYAKPGSHPIFRDRDIAMLCVTLAEPFLRRGETLRKDADKDEKEATKRASVCDFCESQADNYTYRRCDKRNCSCLSPMRRGLSPNIALYNRLLSYYFISYKSRFVVVQLICLTRIRYVRVYTSRYLSISLFRAVRPSVSFFGKKLIRPRRRPAINRDLFTVHTIT